MGNHRFSPQEIVAKLRQGRKLEASGCGTAEVCRRLGVNELTYLRWYKKYGALEAQAIARLRRLEEDNARLTSALVHVEAVIAHLRGLEDEARSGRPQLASVQGGRPGSRG